MSAWQVDDTVYIRNQINGSHPHRIVAIDGERTLVMPPPSPHHGGAQARWVKTSDLRLEP